MIQSEIHYNIECPRCAKHASIQREREQELPIEERLRMLAEEECERNPDVKPMFDSIINDTKFEKLTKD